MVHAHTLPQEGGKLRSGRWDENVDERSENEMKMRMRWRLLGRDTRRGTQKKKERENTNTTHLAQNGQTLKGTGKRKAEADGNRPRPAEGGEDGRAWTNLPRRNLSLPKHARTHTYLERGARMKLGPMGASWWKDTSTTCRARFVVPSKFKSQPSGRLK